MNPVDRVNAWIQAYTSEAEQVVLAPGFEKAFLGIARILGEPIAVYDRDLCLQILRNQGLSDEEAEEDLQYNHEGMMIPEGAPIFVTVVR